MNKHKKLTMKPFTDFRDIKNENELDAYQAEITAGIALQKYVVYGDPVSNDEVKVRYFKYNPELDETYEVKFKQDYFMNAFGDYWKNTKKGKGVIRLNQGKSIGIQTHDTVLSIPSHHLQLISFYPNLDWGDFCKAIYSGTGSVDHILGNHERCHFAYLEACDKSENRKRGNFTVKSKDARVLVGDTLSKPYYMTINGSKIDKLFTSLTMGADYLKAEPYNLKTTQRGHISSCLNKVRKHIVRDNYTITFEYNEVYTNDQQDLEGEVWKYPDDWVQKEKIIQRFDDLNDKCNPPKAISNMGRVLTGTYKKTYGQQIRGKKTSNYCGVPIHIMVNEAFTNNVTNKTDKLVLRDMSHPDVYVKDANGNVIKPERYTNALDTLRIGSDSDKHNNKAEELRTKAEKEPKNEFIVKGKDGVEVGRFHYVPHCVEVLSEKYKDIKFNCSGIRPVLQKKYTQYKGFTFSYVIPR